MESVQEVDKNGFEAIFRRNEACRVGYMIINRRGITH